MHSFYSPANALYELIIGVTCLVTLFGGVFTIPTMIAMIVDSKEKSERQNS